MHSLQVVSLTILLLAVGSAPANAQSSSNIVCWKDKAGKTVGCGDKVPPEYQDNATREITRRGITVKQSDASPTAEQKKAQQAEIDRKQAETLAATEQKRKDRALLDTFTTVGEIDLKRKRDIQLIESNIEAQQTNLKNANDRQADTIVMQSTADTSSKLAEKVLDSTINIPPLIYQNQGGIVGIVVARDVDFSSVYELRPIAR